MPKIAKDYQKTIIYKIVCNDVNVIETYVGHTTAFIKRKKSHKYCCNKEGNKMYNYKIYTIIRTNGGWDNWSMIEIEKYPCNDVNEASARERYWYETLNSTLNSNIPNRTHKEWFEDNREHHKEQHQQYNKENAVKIREQHQQYQKQNADKLKEQRRQKNKENADTINEKRRQKYKEKKNNNPTDPPLL